MTKYNHNRIENTSGSVAGGYDDEKFLQPTDDTIQVPKVDTSTMSFIKTSDVEHKHENGHGHGNTGPAFIMEPVINFVPGVGPTDNSFALYDPEFINVATGEHPFQANKPGEIDTYAASYPPDAELLSFSINNNTAYDITSLTMKIIGSAIDLIPGVSWTVTRDPHVNASFGDANGDGKIGVSNIFSKITISHDGRTLVLSDGVIPSNSHFTDRIFSSTSDGLPAAVGVDGSFHGVLAPDAASSSMLPTG